MLYCYQLSKTRHHEVYRRANFYLVSGVHKRPAWEIYRINRNERARRFALPSQFMRGIDPKDKLVGVLENICDDFEVHEKLSEHLVLLDFLPSEMFDSFSDYFCINDLVVFQSQSLFYDYVLPLHTAYLEAVWNVVRVFNIFYDRQLIIQDYGEN
ncbi:uncharacterized protein [Bemisia tabaci]|uniref:uncharacterized protein n=1 Tax=Bemisia tabaci TaxID=7038 RepID=UPI003B28363D